MREPRLLLSFCSWDDHITALKQATLRAVHSQEYIEWVRRNMKRLDYETTPLAFEWHWQQVRDAAEAEEPEVVLVTQLSIQRCASWSLA